jgi:hypothetical protein
MLKFFAWPSVAPSSQKIILGLTQKATPERGNELLRSDVNPKRSQGS